MSAAANKILYPYLPDGRTYEYVPLAHPWMQSALQVARKQSLDKTMPGGAVIVAPAGMPVVIGGSSVVMAHDTDGGQVSCGANGSSCHETTGCERVRLGCKSGQGYELCEGCSPRNHSEAKAIANAHVQGVDDLRGYHLYLWGHWWCCKDCWAAMDEAGISRVFLMEGSERLFNKEHSENIVDQQFESL